MSNHKLDKVIDVEYRSIEKLQLPERWFPIVMMITGLAILLSVAWQYPRVMAEREQVYQQQITNENKN